MAAVITYNTQLTTTRTSTTTNTLGGVAPSGVKQYDCMLAFLTMKAVTSAPTFPAGWTQVNTLLSDGTNTYVLFFKVATATDASSTYAISWTTNAAASVVISSWTGCDPFNPLQLAEPNPLNCSGLSYAAATGLGWTTNFGAASTSVVAQTVDVFEQNSMLVSIYANGVASTFTVDGSETQAGATSNTAAGSSAIGYLNRTSLGLTGTKTGTSGTSSVWGAITVVLCPPTWTQNNVAPSSCSNMSIVGSYSKFLSSATPASGSWSVTFGSFASSDDTWSISVQPGDLIVGALLLNTGATGVAVTANAFQTASPPAQILQKASGSAYSLCFLYTVPAGVALSGNNATATIEFTWGGVNSGLALMMTCIRGAAGALSVIAPQATNSGNQTAMVAPAVTIQNGDSIVLYFSHVVGAQTPGLASFLTDLGIGGHATGFGGAAGYFYPGNMGTLQTVPFTTTSVTESTFTIAISPPLGASTVGGFPFDLVNATGYTPAPGVAYDNETFPEPVVASTQPGVSIITGYTTPVPFNNEEFPEPLLITGIVNPGTFASAFEQSGTPYAQPVYGSVSGNVAYQGSPIAGATVLLFQRDGMVFVASTTTDVNGNYVFPVPCVLTANFYCVVFQCPTGTFGASNNPGTTYDAIILDDLTAG